MRVTAHTPTALDRSLMSLFRNRERERELEQLLDAAHKRTDAAQANLAHANQQLRDALDQNQQLLAEWRKAHDDRVRLQGDVENLMNLGRWKDDQLGTLQDQNATQAHEISALQQTITSEREQARRELARLGASVEGLTAALNEARQGQAQADAYAGSTAQQLQTLMDQSRDQVALVQQLSRDVNDLQAANFRLSVQLDDTTAQRDAGQYAHGQRIGGINGRPGWVYCTGQGWIPDDLGHLLQPATSPAPADVEAPPAERPQDVAGDVEQAAAPAGRR